MISFIIPCFNEQNDIINTIKEVEKSCQKININNYEIIVVDDGSIDNSNLLVADYKKFHNKKILLINNKKNYGYGNAIKIGALKASKKYIIFVAGDNSHKASEIYKIIRNINKYDVISTYYINSHKRNFFRRTFTGFYTPILNFFFNKNIPYYNGVTLIKRKMFNNFKIETNSHSFQVEMWSKVFLSKKIIYNFVPTYLNDRVEGSNAFKLVNSVKVSYSTLKIIFIFLLKKYLNKNIIY